MITHSKVIPDYAKDFRNEYLFISEINKLFGEIIEEDKFNTPRANKIKSYIKNFLKAQESGRFKDVSNFYFKYYDANNIECLFESLDEYRDYYVDSFGLEFNQERYDRDIDIDFPGFRELFELISLLNDKIKTKDCEVIFSDSDSDSGSESESD